MKGLNKNFRQNSKKLLKNYELAIVLKKIKVKYRIYKNL